jgi:hypothetical protein
MSDVICKEAKYSYVPAKYPEGGIGYARQLASAAGPGRPLERGACKAVASTKLPLIPQSKNPAMIPVPDAVDEVVGSPAHFCPGNHDGRSILRCVRLKHAADRVIVATVNYRPSHPGR